MSHSSLIEQHEAIEVAAQLLLGLCLAPVPSPSEAFRLLNSLEKLVRDHLAVEDEVIYKTVAVTRDTRHGAAAAFSASELDHLKHDWTQYLDRWNEAAISADWDGFVNASRSLLERLSARVSSETIILYSLAEHYAVIGAGNRSAS